MNKYWNQKEASKVDSVEEARRLANELGRVVEFEVVSFDYETEKLIKKLKKRAKLVVIK